MKKLSVFLCCCLLLSLLTGCNQTSNTSEGGNALDPMIPFTHTVSTLEDTSDLLFYTPKSPDYESYLDMVYGLSSDLLDTALFCFSNGASANEVVLVKTSHASDVEELLKTHVENRKADFTGYAPDEVKKLENSQVVSQDRYVALLVGSDTDACVTAFKESLKSGFALNDDESAFEKVINDLAISGKTQADSKEASTQPDEDEPKLIEEKKGVMDIYDTSNIIEAYKNDDDSILTDDHDKEVLKICRQVIDGQITDSMSDYQKELAIHDYLVKTIHYDETALSNEGYYPQYADQPYGALVNHSAICLGYATSFQLFMDLLDIESMIVKGSAYNEEANHAWNIVKLDDGWYWVDVTWDDPVDTDDSYVDHYYFNTDDVTMSTSGHNWNTNRYPSSNGKKYRYTDD